ncbi:MAG: hypothetical protein J7L32_05630, partial [Thermoplasmata archaeon]|nr:hypothetical protein [Thermoplasmata archaeon]
RIYIGFLKELGWGVVLDDTLNVTVNASEDIDYVVFNLTDTRTGLTYIQNDTEPPFETAFMVPNSFFYVITVTGYYNGTACCSDQEGYIAYINLRLSNWP